VTRSTLNGSHGEPLNLARQSLNLYYQRHLTIKQPAEGVCLFKI